MFPFIYRGDDYVLYSYFLGQGIAYTIFVLSFFSESKKLNIPRKHFLNASIIIVLSSSFGGKWASALLQGYSPLKDSLEFLNIWSGGQVFYGGLFLSLLAIFFYTVAKRLSFITMLDALSKPSLLGYSFFRLFACFLTGCCYGKPTTLKIGLSFKPGTFAYQKFGDYPLHPVQLYEFFGGILGFITLHIIEKKKKLRSGDRLLFFLLIFSIIRFLSEFFRGDITLFVIRFPLPFTVVSPRNIYMADSRPLSVHLNLFLYILKEEDYL